MNFEKFLLNDYLQSPDGQRVYSFFKNFRDIFFHRQQVLFHFVDESLLDISIAEDFLASIEEPVKELESFSAQFQDKKVSSFEDFYKTILWKREATVDFRYEQGNMPFYSILSFLVYPEYAFPYLFPCHFYKIDEICQKFNISLPLVPGKTKHLERCNYYFDLCRTFYDFRKQYDLSPIELCVFLYGFAPRFLENFIETALPEPNRIYIVGATSEDVENYLSDIHEFSDNEKTCWQGNKEMLPGDIVIIYETTPYCRIGTIWRAISPGFDDPFHHYAGKVIVSYPKRIPYIAFDELVQDTIWGRKGLVKAHMQGVNGKLVSCEEYEALKKMIKSHNKKFNLRELPNPPPYSQYYRGDLQNEKDIEEKLLEPFLEKLGYKEHEIKRQYPIQMGRGIHYYPDYVLHGFGDVGEERADFIFEAKYRISTKKQLIDAFYQAKSYAIRLATKGFGLVSMEGIWLSSSDEHFDLKKLRHYSWAELENAESFSNVKIFFYHSCPRKK